MWLKTYKINNECIKEFSVKLFKILLFSMQYHKDGGWFRIFKIGIAWTRIPLFGIRNGHKKSLKIRNNYYTFIS